MLVARTLRGHGRGGEVQVSHALIWAPCQIPSRGRELSEGRSTMRVYLYGFPKFDMPLRWQTQVVDGIQHFLTWVRRTIMNGIAVCCEEDPRQMSQRFSLVYTGMKFSGQTYVEPEGRPPPPLPPRPSQGGEIVPIFKRTTNEPDMQYVHVH